MLQQFLGIVVGDRLFLHHRSGVDCTNEGLGCNGLFLFYCRPDGFPHFLQFRGKHNLLHLGGRMDLAALIDGPGGLEGLHHPLGLLRRDRPLLLALFLVDHAGKKAQVQDPELYASFVLDLLLQRGSKLSKALVGHDM